MENELKFVARNYQDLERLLTPFGWYDITQGYLNPTNRLRCITRPDGSQQHFLTFKQRLSSGHNLEIEPSISAAQFTEAWDYTNERLTKRRVPISFDDLLWDVDFYRWSQPYFVLAEVEMPSHMTEPATMLPYLAPHIVYAVPREDDRFAARRLADEAHVRSVARSLGLPDSS